MEAVAPFSDGHKYQNYPKRDFTDFRWYYWGDAFNSLLWVKQKYDPDNFFHYEQSISPYPDEKGITRSTVPSVFSNHDIDYEVQDAAD